jgi:hypothetical protein
LAPNQLPDYLTLEKAYHRGENIGHMLDHLVVEEIEDAALAQIKENWNDC